MRPCGSWPNTARSSTRSPGPCWSGRPSTKRRSWRSPASRPRRRWRTGRSRSRTPVPANRREAQGGPQGADSGRTLRYPRGPDADVAATARTAYAGGAMAGSVDSPRRTTQWLTRRLLEIPTAEAAGPEAREDRPEQHPWWQVICLTGADYFSTLGYMPRRYTEVVVRSSATQREATRP